MNWTTQKPTVSGLYWWRESDHSPCMILHVDVLTGTVSSLGTNEYRQLNEMVRGEWFGPLEQPK